MMKTTSSPSNVAPEQSSEAAGSHWVKCSRCYRVRDSNAALSCPNCDHIPVARRCARCGETTGEKVLCQDCTSWCFNQKAKAKARIRRGGKYRR